MNDLSHTGLTPAQIATIRRVCRRPEVERVTLYGSRARGTHRIGSDIDLAIHGSAVTRRTIAALLSAFDDSPLPYFVDVVHYDTIANHDFRRNIDRDGIDIATNDTDEP